jgi:hypothetical protein
MALQDCSAALIPNIINRSSFSISDLSIALTMSENTWKDLQQKFGVETIIYGIPLGVSYDDYEKQLGRGQRSSNFVIFNFIPTPARLVSLAPMRWKPIGAMHPPRGAVYSKALTVVDRDFGRAAHTRPWQCLNFRPDPHGQGALRGVPAHGARGPAGRGPPRAPPGSAPLPEAARR